VVVPVFVISLYVLGALTVIELWRVTHGPPPAEAAKQPDLEVAAEDAAEPLV
jgi:hypothetical protein